MVEPNSSNFRVFTLKLVGVRKFRIFTCCSKLMTSLDKANVLLKFKM